MASSDKFVQAKVLDVGIFAGRAIHFDDARVIAHEYIPRPHGVGPDDEVFMAKIIGDSLVDQWVRHGDWAVFVPVREVKPGRLYVLSTPDGITVKFAYPASNGGLLLRPGNSRMKDVTYAAEDVIVRGLVVGSYHRFIWDESGEGIARVLQFQRPPVVDDDIPF